MKKQHTHILFLDRDGVINEFPGNGNYVTKVKDFHFIKGSLDALKKLTDTGWTIFVVSNQAGVGKGVYSRHKLNLITAHMLKYVKRSGARIKKIYYCTHRTHEGCWCRKPAIGSVIKALKLLNKRMHHVDDAFFVGDTKVDIQAGHNAGCKTIFVLSGRDTRRDVRKWGCKPDYVAKNLLEATKIINNEDSHRSRLRWRRSSKSR